MYLRNPGWINRNGACARGQAFIEGKLLDAADILLLLSSWHTSRRLRENLQLLNGHFAAIIPGPDGATALICDKCRSIPLFYTQKEERTYVSDDAQWVADQAALRERDPAAELEFEFSGFVQGAGTLVAGLWQVQAGELVLLQSPEAGCRREFYFQHCHTRRSGGATAADFHAELERAVSGAVGRLVKIAGGRQICLAFSGGSDSTMIALALSKQGYTNLRCFTYGFSKSSAVRHSRSMAAAIGLEWDYAEYSPQTWQNWFSRPERCEYYRMAAGHSSLPLIEDWPAVALLKSKGFIADDAVIVNGQTAEAFLYPVHVAPDQTAPYSEDELNLSAIAEAIVLGCYTLGNWSRAAPQQRSQLVQQLEQRLSLITESSFNSSLYEAWVAAERMAKFNVNSVRNYEFWGHDWWLPLWDDEVRQFWCSMPMGLRLDRRNTRAFVAAQFRKQTGRELPAGDGRSRLQKSAAGFRGLARGRRLLNGLYHLARRKYHAAADFRGWHSLFDKADVERNYHHGQNINSLLALEYLGRIEFAASIRC